MGGSPRDQSRARLETGAVFSCGVLIFSLFGFAIDQLDPTARRPERALITAPPVEGFPDVPASPVLTQMSEHADVA